jgi:hypothetical protein
MNIGKQTQSSLTPEPIAIVELDELELVFVGGGITDTIPV